MGLVASLGLLPAALSHSSNLTRRLRQKENKDAIKASLSVLVEKVMRMDMGMGDLPMIMNVLVDEINF